MSDRLSAQLVPLISDFTNRYDERQVFDWLRQLWQSDLPSDFAAFHRTAALATAELRRLGLAEVEIVPCPADGRTRVQSWTMPLAWDGGEAVLEMTAPRREVLCNRAAQPLCVSMWSEPLPPGGAAGPLIFVDDPQTFSTAPADRAKLRGAFLLTGRTGRGEMKVFAHDVGAAAIVSYHVAREDRHLDAVGWSNGWADDPGGWGLLADSRRMTGFQVSPNEGRRLRQLLEQGPVTCQARVGGRNYEGTMPVVTAVLPARSADGASAPGSADQSTATDEILLIGHLYEIGALDNASGAAAMMETMRLLATMPRSRRRVRIVLTSECYGTYSLYTQRPELLARTVAGANLDCVGEAVRPKWSQLFSDTPQANPSAVDHVFRLAMRLTELLVGGVPAEEGPHVLSDNMICDPAAGSAVICFMRAPWHWHCSLDDLSGVDPAAMKRATVATAAYTRWLAEAGPAEADVLAAAVADHAAADLANGGPGGAALPAECAIKPEPRQLADQRRAFFTDRARARVLWTKRLGAQRAEELADRFAALPAGSLVTAADGGDLERRTIPQRSFWGAPTFDGIPPEQRRGLVDPRWAMLYVTACYWIDGRRSVAEIASLVRAEFGKPVDELLNFFEVLASAGLVRLTESR